MHGIKRNDFPCQAMCHRQKKIQTRLQLPPQAQNILKQSKWTLKMSLLLILTCSHNEATAHVF
jgi:hypothetical protein